MDTVVHLKTDLPEWHTMRWDYVADYDHYDEITKFEMLLKYLGISYTTKTEDAVEGNVVCGMKATIGYWAWEKDNAIVKNAFKRHLESQKEEE